MNPTLIVALVLAAIAAIALLLVTDWPGKYAIDAMMVDTPEEFREGNVE